MEYSNSHQVTTNFRSLTSVSLAQKVITCLQNYILPRPLSVLSTLCRWPVSFAGGKGGEEAIFFQLTVSALNV